MMRAEKYFFLILVCLSLFIFFSCKPIQPVTFGGVENTQLKKLSRDGIDFSFGLRIKNPNPVGVTVYPSSFELKINNIDLGILKLNKKVKIKANSDEAPIFEIESDFSKLGMGDLAKILPMVTSKNANISIKGKIKVGKWFYKKKFPVEMKKNIGL